MNKYKLHQLGNKTLVVKQDTTKTHEGISNEEYETDMIYWTPIDMSDPAEVSAARDALGDAWPFE